MSMSPPCLSKQNSHSFSSPEEGDYNNILITQKYSIDKNEPINNINPCISLFLHAEKRAAYSGPQK